VAKLGANELVFVCRAKNPLGKCPVSEFFLRSCPESGPSVGNGLPIKVRGKRPGVLFGLRSQKPVAESRSGCGFAIKVGLFSLAKNSEGDVFFR